MPPEFEPEFDPQLEALVDAELKKLPSVPAPPSLAPNVMALLEARTRQPWWQQAWWEWPLAAKAAFVVAALVLAGLFSSGGLLLDSGLNGVPDSAATGLEEPAPLWGLFGTLAGASQLLWDSVARPYILYLVALAAAAYAVCIGASTMFIRVAVRRN